MYRIQLFLSIFSLLIMTACGDASGDETTTLPARGGNATDIADTSGSDGGNPGDTNSSDNSPSDSGTDMGTDAGNDAGTDAGNGSDSGNNSDNGTDSGSDAGNGNDSGNNSDNGTDNGSDSDSGSHGGNNSGGQAIPGMVEIPAGAFMMGCNSSVDGDCYSDEYPYHQVTLSAFYIDIYEVTAGEYEECVNADGCSYNGTTSRIDRTYQNNKDDHPINYVNWFEAKTYCEWKNKRLPTEAEWEKAARGTDGRLYPWGNQAASCSYALMDDGGDGCGTNLTAPVGSKPAGASIYGVMDMSGSVWEWVSDWYDEDYYSYSPSSNATGPASGDARVLRGGSYNNYLEALRSSSRFSDVPEIREGEGFRCAQ